MLVAALAIGVILASDVFESPASVDRLLFGSLIGLSNQDLWLTAAVLVAALLLDLGLRRAWLAQGFDPGAARALGVRTAIADPLLLLAIVLAAVVALDAVGALLVTAVLVIPAATVRLVAPSVATLQAGHGGAGGRRGRGRAVARLRAEHRSRAGDRRARRRGLRGRGGGDPMAVIRVDDLAGGYAPGTRRDRRRDVRARARHDRGRPRPERRRQDDAVPRAARRTAACSRGDRRAASAPRVRPADRPHAPRLPGQRARRRPDGRLLPHARVAAHPARRPRRRQARRSRASASPTARAATSARCQAASASAC